MKSVRAAVFLTFLLSSSAVLSAQTDEPIRVETALVVLNATVTGRSGRPLDGLGRRDFTVFEDGVLQPLEVFEAQSTPFAAVLLIDSSGSMAERLNLARSAAIAFLDGLRSGDVAAIYSFDSKVETVQDFSGSRDVAERIFDLESDGMTALNDAIVQAAAALADRPEKRRAIVVLSDGADTISGANADRALRSALAANATIYTVDMSSESTNARERMLSQGALRNFADKSGGLFVATPGGTALREAFRDVVMELGIQYTLGYQPANPRRDGRWRSIEVRVSASGAKVRTRKGYNAPK